MATSTCTEYIELQSFPGSFIALYLRIILQMTLCHWPFPVPVRPASATMFTGTLNRSSLSLKRGEVKGEMVLKNLKPDLKNQLRKAHTAVVTGGLY